VGKKPSMGEGPGGFQRGAGGWLFSQQPFEREEGKRGSRKAGKKIGKKTMGKEKKRVAETHWGLQGKGRKRTRKKGAATLALRKGRRGEKS